MNCRSGFPVYAHPIQVKGLQIDTIVVNIRVSLYIRKVHRPPRAV